jgi:hypothetical protein
MRIEKEPITENEIACGFCGPKKLAAWEVALTDGERLFICYADYLALDEAELIVGERRIGEMVWEEGEELKEFLNNQKYE